MICQICGKRSEDIWAHLGDRSSCCGAELVEPVVYAITEKGRAEIERVREGRSLTPAQMQRVEVARLRALVRVLRAQIAELVKENERSEEAHFAAASVVVDEMTAKIAKQRDKAIEAMNEAVAEKQRLQALLALGRDDDA
jgi:DNA-binding PadR family transcriptional regulator